MKKILFNPIGIVHSPFKIPKGVPIQSSAGKNFEATVEIYPEYVEGLKDLEGFSHIILLYHLHLIKQSKLKVIPFMDNVLRGVFSTRAPSRPNPIGLSIVELQKIENNILHIKDVDIVNGTPLLDIKPFVPEFDARENTRIGWLANRKKDLFLTRDDERFV